MLVGRGLYTEEISKSIANCVCGVNDSELPVCEGGVELVDSEFIDGGSGCITGDGEVSSSVVEVISVSVSVAVDNSP